MACQANLIQRRSWTLLQRWIHLSLEVRQGQVAVVQNARSWLSLQVCRFCTQPKHVFTSRTHYICETSDNKNGERQVASFSVHCTTNHAVLRGLVRAYPHRHIQD